MRRSKELKMNAASKAVTIVMIEDDEGHAHLIKKNIRKAGVNNELVECKDGETALKFLLGEDGTGNINQRKQLLILLDLNLPDMTGIEVLNIIKNNAHLKRTPVIILTTTDDGKEIQKCYDLGANVYITKPLSYDGFANAIKQLGLFLTVMQVPENA